MDKQNKKDKKPIQVNFKNTLSLMLIAVFILIVLGQIFSMLNNNTDTTIKEPSIADIAQTVKEGKTFVIDSDNITEKDYNNLVTSLKSEGYDTSKLEVSGRVLRNWRGQVDLTQGENAGFTEKLLQEELIKEYQNNIPDYGGQGDAGTITNIP